MKGFNSPFSVWLCRFLNPKKQIKTSIFCYVCMSYFDLLHAWLELQIFQSRCPIILTCPYGRPICSQLKRAVALLLFPSPFILASSWLFSIRVKKILQIIGSIGTWHAANATVQGCSAPDKARSNPKLPYWKHQTGRARSICRSCFWVLLFLVEHAATTAVSP